MLLVAAVVGLAVGVIVGALGAGGGIVSVPVLVYLLGFTPHDATAASLVIVAVTAVVSVLPHARRGTVDWRTGATFGLLSVVGSLVGGRVSARVDPDVLMASFSALLAAVAVYMAIRGVRERRGAQTRRRSSVLLLVCLSTLTGLLTGFFGVGGGFMVVPILVLVFGLPMRQAAGTSLVIMVITALAGLAARLGTPLGVDWLLVAVFTAGSMLGGLAGEPLTRHAKNYQLTFTFAALLAIVAVYSFCS